MIGIQKRVALLRRVLPDWLGLKADGRDVYIDLASDGESIACEVFERGEVQTDPLADLSNQVWDFTRHVLKIMPDVRFDASCEATRIGSARERLLAQSRLRDALRSADIEIPPYLRRTAGIA